MIFDTCFIIDLLKGDNYESLSKRYNEINKKYKELLDEAKKEANDKRLLYFKYSGELSISADLANELIYSYPGKVIVVVFVKGEKANMSIRGDNVRDILKKVMEDIEGNAGGHRDACGGTINIKDLEKFKSKISYVLGEDGW